MRHRRLQSEHMLISWNVYIVYMFFRRYNGKAFHKFMQFCTNLWNSRRPYWSAVWAGLVIIIIIIIIIKNVLI